MSDTPELFPKLKRRDAHSKAHDKSPRLLGRLKNGIGNVCVNKKLKMTAKKQGRTNWKYVNTSSNNVFWFWFIQDSTTTCVREGMTA